MKFGIIAGNTIKEMVHEKLFVAALVVAVGILGLSLLLGSLSFAEQNKILADIGFVAVQISGLLLAIFGGAYLLPREIEKQTCLLMLARPVSRAEFVLGKVFGLAGFAILVMVSLSLLLGLLLSYSSLQEWVRHLLIVSSLVAETCLLLGLVVLTSLLVRPSIALMVGWVLFLWGHWLPDLQHFAAKSENIILPLVAQVSPWLVPHFSRMNWKTYRVIEIGVEPGEIVWFVTHSLGWALMLSILIVVVFRRKDLV